MSAEGGKVKACPFCGGVTIEIHSKINNLWTAQCNNARCLAEGPWRMDSEAARNGWNYRRTPDPATARVIAAAQTALDTYDGIARAPLLSTADAMERLREALAARGGR